jgi:hypothetical protein
MYEGFLITAKVVVFGWCIYLSLWFLVQLYLHFIRCIVEIYIKKSFKIEVGQIFMIGLPISWTVFFALYFIK